MTDVPRVRRYPRRPIVKRYKKADIEITFDFSAALERFKAFATEIRRPLPVSQGEPNNG